MFRKIFNRGTAADPSPLGPEPIPADNGWDLEFAAAGENETAIADCVRNAVSADKRSMALGKLCDEDLVRALEREFRHKDRRAHSQIKQRYQHLVSIRVTRSEAEQLVSRALALDAEGNVASNHLVELATAWDALDASLTLPQQAEQFAALRTRISQRLQAHADNHRLLAAWSSSVNAQLGRCEQLVSAAALPSRDSAELLAGFEACAAQLRALRASANSIHSDISTEGRRLLLQIEGLETSLQHCAAQDASLRLELEAARLNADHARKCAEKRADSESVDVAPSEVPVAPRVRPVPIGEITAALEKLEAAIAEGLVGAGMDVLPVVKRALEQHRLPSELSSRIHAAQAELLRLRTWQNWSGAKARETIVTEAETLARSVKQAQEKEGKGFPVNQLEAYISKLREQWQQLDRAGGKGSQSLWERFNSALTAAYVPIPEHKEVLTKRRLENLDAREQLLAELDQLALPAATDDPGWKAVSAGLQRFKTRWRELGPVDHSVPQKARSNLLARMSASVERLEQPLRSANADAESQRRLLIEAAVKLAVSSHDRHLTDRVRELQASWKQIAGRHPLPHALESRLWNEFKAALDAVFDAKTAAAQAQRAAIEARRGERELIIRRLSELDPDSTEGEIKRALAEARSAWRDATPMPRGLGLKLESAFSAACELATNMLSQSAQRQWMKTRMTLKERVELLSKRNLDALVSQGVWSPLTGIPTSWDKALQARREQLVNGHAVNSAGDLDSLLLRLELALDISSPMDWNEERRRLKLLQLKASLENHAAGAVPAADLVALMASALACDGDGMQQMNRIHSIIDALDSAMLGVESPDRPIVSIQTRGTRHVQSTDRRPR